VRKFSVKGSIENENTHFVINKIKKKKKKILPFIKKIKKKQKIIVFPCNIKKKIKKKKKKSCLL